MATLVSQTWDGVTPPAIPAGWTADSGIESLASGTAHSAPNETRNTNTSTGRNIYYSSAQDGNSGDVRAQIYARTTTSSSNHSVQVGTRIQSTPYSTCYSAAMIWNGQVQLFRRVAGTGTQLGSTVTISGGISTNAYYIISLQTTGSSPVACEVKVQRVSDSNWLKSDGTWQAGETACISHNDSDVAKLTGQGYVGFRSLNTSSGVCRVDDFFAETIVAGGSFTCSPATVPAQHSGNISLTLTGSGTSWVNGNTDFTSDNADVTVVSVTVASSTSATVVITTGNTTGAGTLTESVTGSSTGSLTVSNATLTLSPATGNLNTPLSVTATGTATVWTQETEATLFDIVSGGTGAAISNIDVLSDTSALFDLDPGSAADTLVIEDASVGNSTDDFAVTDGPVTIQVSHVNFYTSPYNFYRNGSSYVISNCPGAHLPVSFTGSDYIKVLHSLNAFSGTNLRLRGILNGTQVYLNSVANSNTSVSIATGLSTGTTYTGVIWYDGDDSSGTNDKWNTPLMSWKVTGIELAATGQMLSQTLPTDCLLWYGDSVSYGIFSNRTTTHPSGSRASVSPAVYAAKALNCRPGIVAFGSQGYGRAGISGSNVPRIVDLSTPANGAWRNYYSGQSRLTGGLLTPDPKYVVLMLGTADFTNSSGEVATEAGVAAAVDEILAGTVDSKIYVVVPPNRQYLSHITDGFDTAMSGHAQFSSRGEIVTYQGNDSDRVFLVDLGPTLAIGLALSDGVETYPAIDGIHADGPTNGIVGAMVAEAILSTESGSVSSTGNTRGGFVN